MGLQISEIIPKKGVLIESLKEKVIAVDAFNTLYQFLSNIRQLDGTPLMDKKGNITSHLSGLFYRTANLMARGLKLAYVFDGKPPELKQATKELREERKDIAREKYEEARKKGEEEEMGRYAKQFIRLDNDMIEESKELVEALGLPVVQAPSEGEAQASFMAKQKDAYCVASQDYDSLLFEAPVLIQNLTLAKKRRLPNGAFTLIQPTIIELREVLNKLGINQEQLICLGILIGTDYNPKGVKGIGPKHALEFARKFKKPEKIFEAIRKSEKYRLNFDWREIFDLFKNPEITKKYNLKFKKINKEAVIRLLVEKHDFGEERINNALAKLEQQKESLEQKGLGKWF